MSSDEKFNFTEHAERCAARWKREVDVTHHGGSVVRCHARWSGLRSAARSRWHPPVQAAA